MAEMNEMDREEIELLIECFRSRPVLWDVKLRSYKDRALKVTEWEGLAADFNEANTAHDDISSLILQKKVESMKVMYSRNNKKVRESRKSGMAQEEVYKPTLWYFEKLRFLSDSFSVRSGRSNLALQRKVSPYVCILSFFF